MSAEGDADQILVEPDISVVIPVYNEADVLLELARRCHEAAAATGWPHEVILVDDHSTDDSAAVLASMGAPAWLVVHRLEQNVGQFGATCAGLTLARGARVLVLDGDLQDPPETITDLVGAHDLNGGWEEAIFAVKRSREDPLWFRFARVIFGVLGRMGRGHLPSGSGSYVLMNADLAKRVSRVPMTHLNLGAILSTMTRRVSTVPYDKNARAHGTSRVGPLDLALEAIGSLMITGALERWLLLVAVAIPLLTLVSSDAATMSSSLANLVRLIWAFALGGSLWAGLRRRRLLASLRSLRSEPQGSNASPD